MRLHGGLTLVVAFFLALGWWQLDRARSGNELSWVYVVEWPLFAALAVAAWWRLLNDHGPPPASVPLAVRVVSLTLGPATFDRLAFDTMTAVMYLHVSTALPEVHVERCREGHRLHFDEHGDLVGLTVVDLRGLLQNGQPVVITATDRIELGPAQLAVALGVDLTGVASALAD